MELLFVYGSLKRGCSGHRVLLEARAKFICNARTTEKFDVEVLGGYPAAVPSSCGVQLEGELYEVEDLSIVDYYEDVPELYERVMVEVVCRDGRRFRAWMYVAKRT